MSDVITIDTKYLGQPGIAAAYLLVDGGRAAFIENNTTHAVPLLMQALREAGLSPDDVELAIVTHVHLDHAGGSSALMEACPRATLLAHPRAVRHLVDPAKLVASATEVYGAERFKALYGEIRPIAAARVRAVEDGERVQFGSRELAFFHTRGHANHHLCVHDSKSNGVFTGDAFGLIYPALQSRGTFAFPTTSPTDYIPDEAVASVKQILGRRASRIFPTHFGERTDVAEIAQQLVDELAFSHRLFDEARDSALETKELERFCYARLRAHFEQRLVAHGLPTDEETWAFLELDLDLNAQGIAFAAHRARRTR